MKKRQLMELAIINGTYRDSSTKAAAAGETYNIISRNIVHKYLEQCFYSPACEEEWRRLAASAAAETRLLSPGMQQIPNQMRATQGTPLGQISSVSQF